MSDVCCSNCMNGIYMYIYKSVSALAIKVSDAMNFIELIQRT